jgi:hypothetical protein
MWRRVQFTGLLVSMIAIDSDRIGDTFEISLSVSAILQAGVSLSLSAILFSAVPLSIIATLLDSIANNPGDL